MIFSCKIKTYYLILILKICVFDILCVNSKQETHTVETFVDPDTVEIVPGTIGIIREPEIPISTLPIPDNPYSTFRYLEPTWRASANIVPDVPDEDIKGTFMFHQWSPSGFVRVTINATGIPPGKHSVHVHMYGDVSQGCKTTGKYFPINFIGNIDVKEDKKISTTFYSPYLNMFGFHGIVGRSIVIHENAFENHSVPPELYLSPILASDLVVNQEKSAGAPIACGVITITENKSIAKK